MNGWLLEGDVAPAYRAASTVRASSTAAGVYRQIDWVRTGRKCGQLTNDTIATTMMA
jgi:hypothetical protein